MSITKFPDKDMSLLKKRSKSLSESKNRTEKLYKKARKLGLVETYRDFNGKIRTKKEHK